ncbi:hypothetical protein GCM10007063_35010 [Lentibacillus kapialis]|uniref:Uncharacterized protein n=1 Tax=Lentibacillus kapialis TaxID=340214 RepID=A0A917Q3D6_9BACI|nr:hypothetical protein [Lentibacillus kapialis]GGK09535.1 hypothetical protein GCM10007063_35010 [Lentibacillus kapialis]
MDFPAGGVIGDRSYFVRETDHEEIVIGVDDDTGASIRIIYYSNHLPEYLGEDLNRFKKRIGYDGDFKKLEQNHQSLYYTALKSNISLDYAGYILHEKGMGGIEVVYEIDCRDEKEQVCEENQQRYEEKALEWMKSIQFVNEERK